ncbi:hypothetical protein AAG906_040181 [Vitis piasezkii]
MSYLNRVWMATSVAVVNGHADQGCKWKSGARPFQIGKRRFSSGGDSADIRPVSGAGDPDLGRLVGNREERRTQADESLRQVMYFNCWGQS